MSRSHRPTIYIPWNPSDSSDATHTPFPFPLEGLLWSPGPVYTASSPPVNLATVPPAVLFPRQITSLHYPLGTIEIDDDSIVTQKYIEAWLRQMKATVTEDHAVQKIVLELISKVHLTIPVFKEFRDLDSKELTIVKKYLPLALSKITWKDIEPWFRNLNKSLTNDHLRIYTYGHQHSQIPMTIFSRSNGTVFAP